ncbi:pyrroloquinoline quinone biosynthesis protein PqqB [Microvirga sp. M2]|uniref:pyrroloquinoline quinone biosynthesis protein PqqB n=1 Tax=Microvirga sp. M2 TaxID=3073270 RepID=UPI0039C32EDD
MHAIIIGSAAGGGVPQWNCRCPVCRMAWEGDPQVKHRTQSSLAVSPDGARWVLINASPDLRQQIVATPALHPGDGLRHSPIAAVVLTNGDVDHIGGLLTMREGHRFGLYGTKEILDALAGNRIFDVLSRQSVLRQATELDQSFEPVDGLSVTLFPVPGKVPLWQEGAETDIGAATETTVGAMIEAGGRRLAYIPGCAAVSDALRSRLRGIDALLFDGTVLENDDLMRTGVGSKTGWRMGHVPMNGDEGSIAALSGVPVRQRVFVHINNTNPVLIENSIERRRVEQAGWMIAHDGMVISL